MTKILYSPKSRKDLDNIFDYIHDDLNNPVAAKRTVKGILNKINELKEYPQLGPVWYLENNIDSGFRFLRYDDDRDIFCPTPTCKSLFTVLC